MSDKRKDAYNCIWMLYSKIQEVWDRSDNYALIEVKNVGEEEENLCVHVSVMEGPFKPGKAYFVFDSLFEGIDLNEKHVGEIIETIDWVLKGSGRLKDEGGQND